MTSLLKSFLKDQSGVTAIEYAVIGVAMASVLGVALGTDNESGLRSAIDRAFIKITNQIDNPSVGP
ncbi:Flp family type IVb pilin [Vibrio tapetis]|uniref:Flp/Fap pilin component family protein n=1 Tax=Vibrio tapetis subsp. tapetis TaxID=1671868 RepID=A0A2N8ZJ13_9VIBR|nr:Flp family type IVb pilin [Vibrio tapetis]SON51893.1 Flp/Fap pilin component family protein [Vibrio tapetis subsp. tapetis]